MPYTEQELAAISAYVSNDDIEIDGELFSITWKTNEQLRNGCYNADAAHEDQKRMISGLTSAFPKKTWPWGTQTELYRGQDTFYGVSRTPGDVFTVNSFWSTSTDSIVTHSFMKASKTFGKGGKVVSTKRDVALFTLKFPDGVDAIDMAASGHENEILLPPGLTWKVLSSVIKTGGYSKAIDETSIVWDVTLELQAREKGINPLAPPTAPSPQHPAPLP